MLWERWEGEMPQDPRGRGISWDPGYVAATLAAAAAIGAGDGHTRGCQFGEPRVMCVHGTSRHPSPGHGAVLSPGNPPIYPRANPIGRCPKKPSLPQNGSKDHHPGSCVSYTWVLYCACKTLSISIKKASSSVGKEKICRVKIKT